MSRQSIGTLPLEIRQEILASIPDLPSLVSAAAACDALRVALEGDESRIIISVLSNHIPPEVLPEAILVSRCHPPVMKSRRVPPLTPETRWRISHCTHRAYPVPISELMSYIKHWTHDMERPDLGSVALNVEQALEIATLYAAVDRLTDMFIGFCAETSHVPLGDTFTARPPSAAERNRISRAFYRYELFGRLYGMYHGAFNYPLDHIPELRLVETMLWFFPQFTLWEATQLGCIYDFFDSKVTAALNEVAVHDLFFGYCGYMYGDYRTKGEVKEYLTWRLPELLDILSASTFEERRVALVAVGPDGTEAVPDITSVFLSEALSLLEAATTEADVYGYEWPPGRVNVLRLATLPFSPEPDPGPEEVFRKSSRGLYPPIFDGMDWINRRWGYVLWDAERLRSVGVLGNDTEWRRSYDTAPLPPEVLSIGGAQMSVASRSALYKMGFVGWWAPGDESRIVWGRRTELMPEYDNYSDLVGERVVPTEQEMEERRWPPGSLQGAARLWTKMRKASEGTEEQKAEDSSAKE